MASSVPGKIRAVVDKKAGCAVRTCVVSQKNSPVAMGRLDLTLKLGALSEQSVETQRVAASTIPDEQLVGILSRLQTAGD